VDANTSREDRVLMFHGCVNRVLAFAHINVVSEGVDLPLRRLVDAQPVVSPVKWLQQFGRITRPTDEDAYYICTNRNLQRHAYLLEGCIPRTTYIEAEKAFPPSERNSMRVIGLEALGRFKPIRVPLASGLNLTCYMLSALEGGTVVQYAALVHPLMHDPIWAKRGMPKLDDGTKDYKASSARWQSCPPPAELQGFHSIGQGAVTPKMMNWWKRAAGRHGLDASDTVNRKSFAILPICSDLGLRFT
jgi:hypothetical protein